MTEYVKKDSIIENILSLTVYDSVESVRDSVYADFTRKTNEWIGGIYDALVAVKEIEAHDAEPVKHGHWIWMGEQGDSRYMCSVCKCKEDNVPTCNGEPTIWEYCPNCGARMDEVEE